MLLQKMRDRTQTLLFKVIIGAIIFVLGVFGFGAFNLFAPGERVVASVNGADITEAELINTAQRRRQALLAQLGPDADPDLIDAGALQASTLDQLINNKLAEQVSAELGVRASAEQINQAILTTPEFQIEGVFDENTYLRLLGQAGLTPLAYKELVTQSLAQNQLRSGISSTPLVFEWELDQGAAVLAQKRDIAYLRLDQSAVADSLSVTDEEIAAYYDANQLDFMSEESLELEYVSTSLDELVLDPELAPTEAELQERYEVSKADFEPVERRRGSHILVQTNDERDAAAATQIVSELRERVIAGESFRDLAAEFSEDPGSKDNGGDLGFAPRGVYVGPFEETLFTLGTGELSDPVVTEFGVHLILMEEAEISEYPSFEDRKDVLETEIRRKRAGDRFGDLVNNIDDLAYDQPDTLDGLVSELGLTKTTVAGVTRQSGPPPFTSPDVLKAAFSADVLDNGYNSKAIRTDNDQVLVMRLVERKEPQVRELDDVSEDIKTRLLADAAGLKIAELTGSLVSQLEEGVATDEVADAAGVKWQRIERGGRNESAQDPTIVRKAFELSPPAEAGRSIGRAQLPDNATAVIVVTAVYPGDKSALTEQEFAALQNQLLRRSADLEFGALFETAQSEARINR